MLSDDQISILKDVFGNYFVSRRGQELNFHCPFCGHEEKKFAINKENEKWRCWSAKCAKRGSDISYIIQRFGNSEQRAKWFSNSSGGIDFDLFNNLFGVSPTSYRPGIMALPTEFISLVGNNSLMAKRAKNYLYKRGLNEIDINYWKLGFCMSGQYDNRIIIPSFDESGNINYFTGRTMDEEEEKKKYLNPDVERKSLIFNELYLDFSKPLVIVEGVFDMIVAKENCVPLVGSVITEEYLLFKRIVENKTKILFGLDPDAEREERRLMQLFIRYDIEVGKVNVAPFKDIGEMTKEEFSNRREIVTSYDNDSIFERMIYGI